MRPRRDVVSAALLLAALILIEVAILTPVILVQRERDEEEGGRVLDGVSDDFNSTMSNAINRLVYGTVRNKVAMSFIPGYATQEQFHEAVAREFDPDIIPGQLFTWSPVVTHAERAAYEAFYNWTIVDFDPTQTPPLVPAPARPWYIPLTLGDPNPLVVGRSAGLDLGHHAATAHLFTNASLATILTNYLFSTTPEDDFLFALLAYDPTSPGYSYGRVEFPAFRDSLRSKVQVPFDLVVYDTLKPPDSQLVYRDNSTMLEELNTVAEFEASPLRSQFNVRYIDLPLSRVLLGMYFSDENVQEASPSTWVVLVAVLVPVCLLIDIFVAVLAFSYIISKRQKEEERNKTMASQLMLSYVNHEVRNPLQAIVGLADIMLEELAADTMSKEDMHDDLETIMRSAEFLEHVASDILDVRRIQEGQLVLTREEVKLETLLGDLRRTAMPMQRNGVVFETQLDGKLQSTVYIDRYRVVQILLNFITNAFKFTDSGRVSLAAALSDDGANLVFTVTDTGRGMSQEQMDLLFKEFSQLADDDHNRGFGLGLFLSQLLAKQLGGSVEAHSNGSGNGSTFSLIIPYTESVIENQFGSGFPVRKRRDVFRKS